MRMKNAKMLFSSGISNVVVALNFNSKPAFTRLGNQLNNKEQSIKVALFYIIKSEIIMVHKILFFLTLRSNTTGSDSIISPSENFQQSGCQSFYIYQTKFLGTRPSLCYKWTNNLLFLNYYFRLKNITPY
jgi:hypothetical protein